jgi:branched-chain amino acid transport system substrate-binding protein
LIAAIKKNANSSTPWGDISFDAYNNIVGPVYIREVAKRPGTDGLWNKVLKAYAKVNQFAGTTAKAAIARPAYSETVNGQQ